MSSTTALKAVSPYFPPLPALKDFIQMYRLDSNKTLSQNFLMDMNLTRKLVNKARGITDAFVVEVGPGPGGITRAILEQPCKRLDVVEIDKQFLLPLEHLSKHSDGRMNIHRGDILKTDVGDIWTRAGASKHDWIEDRPPFHIIGNLPFHISTPLIIKFLKEISTRSGPFAFGRIPLTFTLQCEVAERVIAPMDTDFRSRIGVCCQNLTEPTKLFDIPGKCFTPRPDIDVGVVQFIPRVEPLIPTAFVVADKVIRSLFHFKRRYIIRSLKNLYPKIMAHQMAHELLKNCGIEQDDLVMRLSMQEVAAICLFYEKQCREVPGLFLYDYTHPVALEQLAREDNPFPPKKPKQINELEQIDNDGMSLGEWNAKWAPGKRHPFQSENEQNERRNGEGEESGED